MVKKDFLHRKLRFVLVTCCVLATVACAPKNDDAVGTEVVETEGLNAEISEQTEVVDEYLTEEKESSWVADLDVAETANQIIVVAADGSNANVSMHNKEEDGTWTEILSAAGKIGRNGIGKTKEGDGKTPTGVYHFMFGFGTMPDPGCGMNYIQVDDSYY